MLNGIWIIFGFKPACVIIDSLLSKCKWRYVPIWIELKKIEREIRKFQFQNHLLESELKQ